MPRAQHDLDLIGRRLEPMPPAVIARLEHELDRVLQRGPFRYADEPLACEQVGGILQGDQPRPVGERDRAGEPARVVDAVVLDHRSRV